MIADWASIWILIDEFEKLYQNPTASLPRIEYNFSDYIYCEKVKKYTPKYFSDREYWIERLAEFPEKPDLPIINAVENIDKNVIFKRYKFVVEKNKWKTIQLISSKMGLTSSAVILSAYAMVISKWSTNKKFVMNLTTLNRNSYEKTLKLVRKNMICRVACCILLFWKWQNYVPKKKQFKMKMKYGLSVN